MFASVGTWLQQATATAAQTLSDTSSKLVEQSRVHDFVTALSVEVAELRDELAQAMAAEDASDNEDDSNNKNNNNNDSSNKNNDDAAKNDGERHDVREAGKGSASRGSDDDAADATVLRLCDVCTPPAHWSASATTWLALLRAALSDDDTFRLSPARIVADAARWRRVCAVLTSVADNNNTSDDSVAAVTRACIAQLARTADVVASGDATPPPLRCVPHADVLSWLSADPALHATYTHVMPRYVSDDAYWHTVGWKCACYRACTRPEQLLQLMPLLATPLSAADTRSHNDHNDNAVDDNDNDATTTPYWQRVVGEWRDAEQRRASLHAQEQHVRKAIALADDSAATLQEALASATAAASAVDDNNNDSGDATATTTTTRPLLLLQTLRESCEFHAYKLSRLLSQLCEQHAQLQDTSLDQYTGALFAQLMQTRSRLEHVLHAAATVATTTATSSSSVAVAQTHNDATTMAAAAATCVHDSTVDNDACTTTTTTTSHKQSSHDDIGDGDGGDGRGVAVDDASFVATMPWEEDDDDV